MLTNEQLYPILGDEALTRGLGDAEARMLVEWVVARAEEFTQNAQAHVNQLCLWARAVSRFVYLWCYAGQPAAAYQLAATERFPWTLPAEWLDPCELMEEILLGSSNGLRE